MKKLTLRNISIICAICLIICMASGFASAELSGVSAEVKPSGTVPMYFNGIKMSDGIKVENTTYVPLRAFLDLMDNQASVAWDAEANTAVVTDGLLSFSVTVGSQVMTINDRYFFLPFGALVIDGALCLPVRELAKAYGAEVHWDEPTASVSIVADDPAVLESGKDFYGEEDLYWLSRLINAESGNQSLEGKIAVGNVVLNRLADPSCPDTIYAVIFDARYGVQFSVTENGTIYDEPNEESVVAAKLCLEGYNLAGNSIYFVNPVVGVSSWFIQTRVFISTIGDHDFYA